MISFLKNKKILIIFALVIISIGTIYLRSIYFSKNAHYKYSSCEIEYTEAPNHIGEYCIVDGNVKKVYTSKKGTVFLDFCYNYKICPFSAVIFKSYSNKFPDIEKYEHHNVHVNGLVTVYKGKAEMLLENADQIKY